jgi:hypothetical protein
MRAHGSPPTQEVFRFDAIMDVRVAAVGRHRPAGAHAALSGTRGSKRPCVRITHDSTREGVPLPLTQTQLATAVADRAEIPRAEATRVLGALEEIVLEELDNAQKVRVGVLCS